MAYRSYRSYLFMRLPKLYDKGTLKRTGIAVGILAVLFLCFYAWQPWRFDLVERKPNKRLPRIAIEETGLFERGKRIALVTAHPDDEAFYLGGTLFKLKESGAKTTLLVLTDGDKGYYPFFDSVSLAKTRKKETQESAKTVGIEEVVFFSFPDGRLSFEDKTVKRLAEEIIELSPEIVLTNDPLYWPRLSHRDHRVSGEITAKALEEIGFTGWVLFFQTNGPNTFADVDRHWGDAQDLLGVHKSQFFGERLERIKAMVSERALNAGEKFGAGFAEPFRAVYFSKGAVSTRAPSK